VANLTEASRSPVIRVDSSSRKLCEKSFISDAPGVTGGFSPSCDPARKAPAPNIASNASPMTRTPSRGLRAKTRGARASTRGSRGSERRDELESEVQPFIVLCVARGSVDEVDPVVPDLDLG